MALARVMQMEESESAGREAAVLELQAQLREAIKGDATANTTQSQAVGAGARADHSIIRERYVDGAAIASAVEHALGNAAAEFLQI